MHKTTTTNTACNWLQRTLRLFALWILSLGALSACAVATGGLGEGDTWREEVLLHDGQKIIVQRSQTYGGRHEIGQSAPAREHSIRFVMPNTSREVTWTSEYGEGLGRTNFNLLALHIKQDTAYLIVEPNLCLSYNKWGRPNPPYLIFKWEATAWSQLTMAELPQEFVDINLIVNNSRIEEIQKESQATGYVPADYVKVMNGRLPQPQYRSILRGPMNYDSSCIPMVTNGNGLWLSKGWFSSKPTLEACLMGCKRENFGEETCPCNQIFQEKQK